MDISTTTQNRHSYPSTYLHKTCTRTHIHTHARARAHTHTTHTPHIRTHTLHTRTQTHTNTCTQTHTTHTLVNYTVLTVSEILIKSKIDVPTNYSRSNCPNTVHTHTPLEDVL